MAAYKKVKHFILAPQPHEVSHRADVSLAGRRTTALSFCLALVLFVGSAVAFTTPDAHYNAVRKGLERVALGKQMCPLMPQSDAIMLLKEWYGITVTCSEPTESMWRQYCQQFYVSEGWDCSAATPENKALIMNNMRVCKVKYGN